MRSQDSLGERALGYGVREWPLAAPAKHAIEAELTRRSEFERARRVAENERMVEIERAWRGSIPADVASKFDAQVRAAQARGPLPPPPNMAPGTQPRPPRPGHEPKPKKLDERERRGR